MTRAHDELIRCLVGTVPLALRRLAPRRNRVTTAGGAAFTAAVWVVDRVHDDAANVRTLAAPARTTGLAVVDVAVVGVRNGADRGKAGAVNQALFAGVQTQDRHAGIAADELDIGTGRTSDLATLGPLHLNVVNDRTDRNELQ